MRSNAPRSGKILEQLWERFVAKYGTDFPEAKALSKRTVSDWLTADTHALARWTNDAAHQALHPQWRIPLRRVPEACYVLEATSDERDELMLARLKEIQESDEKSDVMVLMHWLEPTLRELATRPLLDAHELQLVAAFQRARDATPGAETVAVPIELDDELKRALLDWLSRALSIYADEVTTGHDADAEVDTPEVNERAKKVLIGMAKRKAALKHSAPSKREMQQVVRRFRQAMRKAREDATAA